MLLDLPHCDVHMAEATLRDVLSEQAKAEILRHALDQERPLDPDGFRLGWAPLGLGPFGLREPVPQ
jgi:hypothetical protein